MGLLDTIRQKVIVGYRADIEDHREKLKTLTDEQKKLSREIVADLEAQARGYEILGTKIVAATAIAAGAFAIAKSGYEAYVKSTGQASKAVEDLASQVQTAMNDIQVSIGRVVVAAAPMVSMFGTLANELATVAAGVGDVTAGILSLVSAIPGVEKLGWALRNLNPVGAGSRIASGAISAFRSGGAWATSNKLVTPDAPWDTRADEIARRRAAGLPDIPWAERQALERQRRAETNARDLVLGLPGVSSFIDGVERLLTGAKSNSKSKERVSREPTNKKDPLLALIDKAVYDNSETQQRHRDQIAARLAEKDAKAGKFDTSQFDGLAERLMKTAEMIRGQHRASLIESIFGTPDEINLTTEALRQAAGVIDMMTGAVQAGVDAWITGSASFVQAAQQAVAGSLRAMAVEFTGQAVRYGLAALGDLAWGDLPGAAAKGQVAAAYAAGAVVAGGLARGLGGGGAATAGVGSGGFARSSGAGSVGSSTPERSVTVVIGGGDDDSPRARSRRLARSLAVAERQGFSSHTPGVVYS